MRKFFCLLAIVLFIPVVNSGLADAKDIADEFVVKHGKFYHRFSVVDEVRIFRRLHVETPSEISFMYLVVADTGSRNVEGRFLVTLSKQDLSVISLEILNKDSTRKAGYLA